MTLEEWGELDDEIEGEFVDGYLEEEEMGSFLHDIVVGWFITVLTTWIKPRYGFVAASEVKYGVSKTRGRKPDVSVFFSGRKPRTRGLVRLPPDIAVEIISETARDRRRDRVTKAGEYARFSIRYYWLVDPAARTLEIFELGSDGRYVVALGADSGVIDNVPGCEGLRLDLDDLWAEVDRIEAEEDPAGGEAEEVDDSE